MSGINSNDTNLTYNLAAIEINSDSSGEHFVNMDNMNLKVLNQDNIIDFSGALLNQLDKRISRS